MLTLNDGRSELWQWDTGRTLAVDADCSQVHFSNKVFGRSIDVDVADGAAIIPDILLQTDKDLNVWAFVGTAENGYTKISKTFKVNRRNKPADYVFTPQEQILLKDAIAIVETAKSAANDAIESSKQAEASADKAAQIADDMKKLADQVEQNTEAAIQAKADALIAQAKAEAAFASAEAARDAAEDSANSAGTNASAASAAATRAENAANDAAAELDTIRSLYQEMQEYVSQSIQDVQTEGNTQVQRVVEEGAAQIAAAKEQADRADVAKEAAEDAAASAQTVAGAIQAESEQIGKNTVDIASIQTQMYQNAPGIVEAAEGKTIALDDSSDKPLQGLTIYGMTTQNGTPMPDSPVELVSVGDGGSIAVNIGTSQEDTSPQIIALSTPNGLPGIQVTSGGNYTDADGQQWICDEVDFAKGVYIQRVKQKRVSSALGWLYSASTVRFYARDNDFAAGDNYSKAICLCSHFKTNIASISEDLAVTFINPSLNGYAYRYNAMNGDVAAWKDFLGNNEVYILGLLATPIETPIPEDALAVYAALHTNKPNTTIYTDSGVHMEVQYVADTKLYIDKQFAELRNAVVSLGANV